MMLRLTYIEYFSSLSLTRASDSYLNNSVTIDVNFTLLEHAQEEVFVGLYLNADNVVP